MSSSQGNPGRKGRTVSLVTLGCARNEVDSEELAARLDVAGWTLVDGPGADGEGGGEQAAPDVVVVNTCGFIQAAKEESIDQLLGASAAGTKVLAERYGAGLAEALPEAQVLSFDDYGDIAARLDAVVDGQRWPAHAPRDRRRLLPISPAGRPAAGAHLPGHATGIPDLPPGVAPASGPRIMRRRLDGGVVAPLKIASGCDRRCSFCAIPAFRGAFISRPPRDLVAEAQWLAAKVRALRVFPDSEGRMNEPLGDRGVLCVSQFTLYGDTRRGNRPSYVAAAPPDVAEPLYELFCELVGAARGVFGAHMMVELVNDGPVTLMLESR